MHSIRIAEWILALVTSRDRAASVAGDLTEKAATRGALWFWSGVLRTTASLLWHDLTQNPARVTALAFLCLAIYIGIDLLFGALDGITFFIAALANPHFSIDSIAWQVWFTAPFLLSSLLIGRLLARWAPGRELAACVVYAIVVSIYNLVPMLGDNASFYAVLCVLIVPAGAAWGRSRRLGATRRLP